MSAAKPASTSRKVNEVTPPTDVMDDLPDDAILWSVNSEIAKVQRQNMYNAVLFTFTGFFAIIICFKILSVFGLDNLIILFILAAIIAFMLWKELSGNESTRLKKNDMDGKTMLRWQHPPDSITRGILSLINQALSFRDAQERDFDSEDPIEMAREREELEFYPAERVWEETTQGSLAPEPGALLRKMRTHSAEIIKKDDEQ